jgi:stage V sporulation protein S
LIEVLKVSSKSNPNSVAGALAGVVRSTGSVEIQVVGAGALNQAVKALAIARGYMANTGLDLACRPTFADIQIDGESRTAIRLIVESCRPDSPLAVKPGPTETARNRDSNGHARGLETPAPSETGASSDPATD